MNGYWYPWGVGVNGNTSGDYVAAWRHVHDVFAQVGATNVVWLWSPNIIRSLPRVGLADLYPGDAYVDWVGLTGYAKPESTADAVFQPTINRLRRFTTKPLLITETGAAPGPQKAPFTADLLAWTAARTDVLGFVWFEKTNPGSRADWRFESDPGSLAAMRTGLDNFPLAG